MSGKIQIDATELEEFKASRGWEYITQQLEEQRAEFNRQLRTLEGVELYRTQGKAQELDAILALPDAKLAVLRLKAKQQEENRHGQDGTV